LGFLPSFSDRKTFGRLSLSMLCSHQASAMGRVEALRHMIAEQAPGHRQCDPDPNTLGLKHGYGPKILGPLNGPVESNTNNDDVWGVPACPDRYPN